MQTDGLVSLHFPIFPLLHNSNAADVRRTGRMKSSYNLIELHILSEVVRVKIRQKVNATC